MRWAVLLVALGVAGAASCGQKTASFFVIEITDRFVVPANIPGWFAFCVEHPAMNMERPGEPKVGGWTTCTGTVDQLRDRVNQVRAVGGP